MRVEVTAEDIKKGHRLSRAACPIALALLRKPGVTGASVNAYSLWLYPEWGGSRGYRPPGKVRAFIERYDRGEEVVPFSFEAKPL